jgi:hypothetical protein
MTFGTYGKISTLFDAEMFFHKACKKHGESVKRNSQKNSIPFWAPDLMLNTIVAHVVLAFS